MKGCYVLRSNLYNQVVSAIYSQSAHVVLDSVATADEVRNAIRWVMRDNPDIFWFSHQYYFDEKLSAVYFQYTFSPDRVKTIQQDIKDVVDNDFCIEYVKTLNSHEQIAYVYKWLVTYCNYNTNSAYNQSIYSVFVRRNSVCTGYAKAAQYLFDLLGIESCLVFGRLNKDKEYGRHCWNLVGLDNQYYHFDVCFGDSILDDVAIMSGVQDLFKIDDVSYNFFCVSTAEILGTRSIEDIETLPICPTSWTRSLVKSLAGLEVKHRDGIKACLLSQAGSTADIYLCAKDKNTILKVFRANNQTTCVEEFHYMKQMVGCMHILQCNECYTDVEKGIIAVEQSTSLLDLLCSHYYEFSLKDLVKMAIDVAEAWIECRDRGVLYRDIHICNIYRSDDGVYKLGDFGSCTNNFNVKEIVGNRWFISPETFTLGIFTEASAVYSITMVMYFILNNLRPVFWKPGCEDEAFRKRIMAHELPMPIGCTDFPPSIKGNVNDFFRKSLALSSADRLNNIEELIFALQRFSNGNESSDYIIHRRGVSFDVDLEIRSNVCWNCISHNAYHGVTMGGEVERMCVSALSFAPQQKIDDVFDSFGGTMQTAVTPKVTFIPNLTKNKKSFWNKLFGKKYSEVYSSIFAPAEVKRKSHFLVQVYLHLYEESEKVKSVAKESDKNAERRDYIPLSFNLRKGDRVDVEFNIYGENRLMSERKSAIWQGSFTKCSFDYFVSMDIGIDELSCEANIFVNGAMIGEMRFVTQIVDAPRNLNTEILSHRFNKIFISYAHQDAQQIKLLALAYKAQGIDYFYDRDSLAPGDVYEEKIFEYIDSSDLFVLCWSKNAAISDYVAKEKGRALLRAYPQQSYKEATLKICPISIEPRAELPIEMKHIYNFEMI